MKKKHVSSLWLLLLSLSAMNLRSQVTNWHLNPNVINEAENAKLGTLNKRSVHLVSNDSIRFTLDSVGNLRSTKWVSADQKNYRMLMVNPNGNVGPADGPIGGFVNNPCIPGSMVWYLGGNSVQGPNNNIIGPCNNSNFIMQAYSKKCLVITAADGFVGVGENNSSPTALLDIMDPSSITNPTGSRTKIYGDGEGAIESTGGMNLYYNNSAYSGTYFNVIEGANGGGSNTTRLTLNGSGNFGVGTNLPSARLHVYENTGLGASIGNSQILTSVVGAVNSNKFQNNVYLIRDNSATGWTGASLHDGISVDGSFLTPGSTTKTWWQRQPYQDKQLWGTATATYMTLESGSLYIGDDRPKVGGVAIGAKLCVDGMILAKDIRVAINTTTHWKDVVFEKSYKLINLEEVEAFVNANKHLPEIPSEAEVRKDGVDLLQMNIQLLQKIEELYLYTIDLNKKVKALENSLQVNSK